MEDIKKTCKQLISRQRVMLTVASTVALFLFVANLTFGSHIVALLPIVGLIAVALAAAIGPQRL